MDGQINSNLPIHLFYFFDMRLLFMHTSYLLADGDEEFIPRISVDKFTVFYVLNHPH